MATPAQLIEYALAAALRREGLSTIQILKEFHRCGRPICRSSIQRILKRAAAAGMNVPSLSQTEALALYWSDPKAHEARSEQNRRVWQDPTYGHAQRQVLAARAAQIRGSKNPNRNKRHAFLNKLRISTNLTREERLAEADKYFPRPTG